MGISKLSKIIILSLSCIMAEPACAQSGRLSFPAYSSYVSKVYDIFWKRPGGFADLNTSTYWSPCGKNSSTLSYNFIFKSKDADCMIMYPEIGLTYFPKDKIKVLNAGRLIYGDLGCIGKDGILRENATHEFEERVTILSGDHAKKLFNADSVYVCAIPLEQPYQGKYPYCTGVYVSKQNRPAMYFKCFFTERGKQKEDEYLDKLYKAIEYRNENWTYDDEKYVQENYKLYLKKRKVTQ